jgi:endonuclease/exonuclease/phosphatase family metal-dependent hydrolase
MRITSWNLLHGQPIPPLSAGPSQESLAAAVRQLETEVIAVQEVDYKLPRSNSRNQVSDIADAIGGKDWAFAPSIIGTPGEKWRKLKDIDPRIVSGENNSLEGSYGIAIASTIPVVKWHRLDLGNSVVGMPLVVPTENETSSKPKIRAIYVHDEPRLALGATLANGWTVFNTHLSFVPGVNLFQLKKLKRWALKVGQETNTKPLILGDLNLPKNLPVAGSDWKSLIQQNTYPSWGAKIQFDYLLTHGESVESVKDLGTITTGISDHLPLRAQIG